MATAKARHISTQLHVETWHCHVSKIDSLIVTCLSQASTSSPARDRSARLSSVLLDIVRNKSRKIQMATARATVYRPKPA